MNKVLCSSFLLLIFIHSILCCISRPPRPPPSPPPADCKCGVPQVLRNRIVGGQPASKNEYPWLVAIVKRGSTRSFCGGVLISSRTVLTAAHCNVYSAFQVRVHVGEHDLTTSDGEQKMSVRRWTNHPIYNRNNNDNDFAVIELSSDVRFSDTVMPICMPNPSANYDNRVATVAGWGTTSSGGSTTTTPQEVDVDTITNSACTTNTLYSSNDITTNMLCARRSGKDACQGDSGGPLMTKESNFFSVIGVVSWGIGCAQANAPGVYARVTKQSSWIQGQIRGTTCPKP